MHRLESSRYNEPSRSPSPWLIQEYSSKNTKNIQAGPTSERAPPPAHTVAASPPAGSSGGEGIACRCRLPPTTTRHYRCLPSCQIWRRGWCRPCYRLPPARSDRGEVATPAGARGWGDRHRQCSRVGRRERESCERERDKDDVLMVLARGQGRARVDKTHSARLDFFWYLFSKKPTPII